MGHGLRTRGLEFIGHAGCPDAVNVGHNDLRATRCQQARHAGAYARGTARHQRHLASKFRMA
jgi:hypothetical protein